MGCFKFGNMANEEQLKKESAYFKPLKKRKKGKKFIKGKDRQRTHGGLFFLGFRVRGGSPERGKKR